MCDTGDIPMTNNFPIFAQRSQGTKKTSSVNSRIGFSHHEMMVFVMIIRICGFDSRRQCNELSLDVT